MLIHKIPLKNKVLRMLWRFCWFSFASWTPIFLHKWRILLINLFGGKVDFSGFIYPDVRIWDPKNLIMGKKSCLGPGVECYNVAQIKIGNFATISQRVFLCSASHDYNQSIIKNNEMDLLIGPIFIEDFSWIAAEAFIGPSVNIEYGSVILARSVVTKNTKKLGVYGGNPINYIKDRTGIINPEK